MYIFPDEMLQLHGLPRALDYRLRAGEIRRSADGSTLTPHIYGANQPLSIGTVISNNYSLNFRAMNIK